MNRNNKSTCQVSTGSTQDVKKCRWLAIFAISMLLLTNVRISACQIELADDDFQAIGSANDSRVVPAISDSDFQSQKETGLGPANDASRPHHVADRAAAESLSEIEDSKVQTQVSESDPQQEFTSDAVMVGSAADTSDLWASPFGESATSLQSSDQTEGKNEQDDSVWSLDSITDRKTFPTRVKMMLSLAAISLVPAILLMTTCFVRIVVVLGILRQAIGLQQLPPTQVMTALALIMTFLVMTPTWKKIKEDAIDPYSAEGSEMTWDEAWKAGTTPLKKFMWRQIQQAENEQDFWLFYDYLPDEEKSSSIQSFDEIPLKVMMPAFLISELKVAFLIGVQIYLPFLILDIVVASFSNTVGLLMLPPTVASLPLKLILFVLVDGWNLVVGMLLHSFAPVG